MEGEGEGKGSESAVGVGRVHSEASLVGVNVGWGVITTRYAF